MKTTLETIASIHPTLWKPKEAEDGYRVFERCVEEGILYTLNVTKTDTIDKLNFEIDGVDYSKEYREYLNNLDNFKQPGNETNI